MKIYYSDGTEIKIGDYVAFRHSYCYFISRIVFERGAYIARAKDKDYVLADLSGKSWDGVRCLALIKQDVIIETGNKEK